MSKTRETSSVRREQIIDAAQKMIVGYGGEHVTIRKIAGEVGISKGAVYRHFKSKKGILALLVDRRTDSLLQDLAKRVNRAKKNATSKTSLELVDGHVRCHLSSIEEGWGNYFQIIPEIISLGDRELNIKVADSIDKYIGGLEDLLAEGVRAGEVKNDVNLNAAATILFGMMQGIASIWYLHSYNSSGNRFDLAQKYSSLWNTFRGSIINPSGEEPR